MPTESQLDIILESQLEFFGGTGLPKQNYEGIADGHGFTQEKIVDAPQIPQHSFFRFSGESIGEIILNPETKEFTITVIGK